MMEPPFRAQSEMQMRPAPFQARATQMLKTIRSKFGGKTTKCEELDGPYKRRTRSMDVRMSQPSLGLQMNSGPTDAHSSRTASSMSTSPAPLYLSPTSTWDTLGQVPVRLTKSESMSTKARPHNTKTAGVATSDQVLARVQTGAGAPDIIVSASRIPVEEVPYGGQVAVPPIDETLALVTEQAPKLPPTVSKNIPNALRAAHASSTAPVPLSAETQPPIAPSTTTKNISNALRAAHASSAAPALPPADTTTSRPRPISHSSSPAVSVSSRRAAAPRIADMPPPSAFRISDNGSVRLSPSIITRQVPMPLLHLPKMPDPSSNPPRPSPKPQARLRSMPALSVDGTNELDREADHENAALGDSDEEDEGEEMHGGSDEDGEDLTQTMSSHSSSQSNLRPAAASARLSGLPAIDTNPFDFSFPAFRSPMARASGLAGPSAPPRLEGEVTPTTSSSFDYFSLKPPPSPSRTPQVGNTKPKLSSKTRPATSAGTPMPRSLPMPPLPGPSRPALYHHVSKSMINIVSPKQELMPAKDLDMIKSHGKGKGKAPAVPDVPTACPAYSEGPTLRRRRSMPIFNATSDPPPYPTFTRQDAFRIMPRDDEGMERLPEYSNSIHLTAIMPRKMEFSSPGIQAKDRKWRRALCELQGTVFRVYKCPPGATGGGVIGEWWEKKVGVGDIAATGASASTVNDVLTNETVRAGERPSKLGPGSQAFSNVTTVTGSLRVQDERPSQPQPTGSAQKARRLTATLPHPITRGGSSPAQSRPHLRSQSDAPMPSGEASLRPRPSLNIRRSDTRSSSQLNASFISSPNQSTTGGTPSPSSPPTSSASRSSFFPRPSGRNSVTSFTRSSSDVSPDASDLIRAYTLQNAESGLGNDYLKRKNVIRVRMEGEQFLLQAHDVADVVEWIECLHAASNIALDLDERVMPKGPMFPRRRRRRRRPEPGGTNTATPTDRTTPS